IASASNRFVVVIENKIGTGEHSDQLARYFEYATRQFADWRILPIFLTPEGSPATHENYVAVAYSLVEQVVRETVASYESTIGADVKIALQHYSQLLQRHVMSESDIAELCRKIYKKHQRALDLIFEHR